MTTEEALQDLFAVFHIYRTMGVRSEDIYVTEAVEVENGPVCVALLAKKWGKTCLTALPDTAGQSEAVLKAWPDFARWANGATQEELQKLWDASPMKTQAVKIIEAMAIKGMLE